ncbi:MAG: hypothetical protein WBN22_00290, partial [Verrucomicrobiia bacterium]
MDENRPSETAKNPGEGAEEGSVQGLYGQAKHSAADSIDAVRKLPGSVEDALRHYIEHRPYTTVAIALALGWLI